MEMKRKEVSKTVPKITPEIINCKGIENCNLLPDAVKKSPLQNGIKFVIDKRARQVMYRDRKDNLTVYCFIDFKDLFKHLAEEVLGEIN